MITTAVIKTGRVIVIFDSGLQSSSPKALREVVMVAVSAAEVAAVTGDVTTAIRGPDP